MSQRNRGLFAFLLCVATTFSSVGLRSSGVDAKGIRADSTGNTLNIGPLTAQVRGPIQPPVTAGDYGAVVSGLGGGEFVSLVLRDTTPSVGELRILYTHSGDIIMVNVDGTGETKIAEGSSPVWSPDGTRVAYVGQDSSGQSSIVIINSDGTNPRIISNTGLVFDLAWAPDGTKIAFAKQVDTQAFRQDIFVVDVDGTNLRNLTQSVLTNSTVRNLGPSWSPDSRGIIFYSDRDNPINENSGARRSIWHIYTMDLDGSNVRRMTMPSSSGLQRESSPAWSPDGSKIAFVGSTDANDGRRNEIYVIDTAGTTPTRLTNNDLNDSNPKWSPDGSKIVFRQETIVFNQFGSPRPGAGDLFLMNADGPGLARLTRYGDSSAVSASWSPFLPLRSLIGPGGAFGDRAAGFLLARARDNIRSIVVFDADNRNNVRITAQTGSTPGLPNIVFAVTVEGGSLTRLAYLNGAAGNPTVVVGQGGGVATASGALVDFNADTGRVTAIFPYNVGVGGN